MRTRSLFGEIDMSCVIYFVIAVGVFQLSCSHVEKPKVAEQYTYGGSMMDNTLKKGTTYSLSKKSQYVRNEIVLFEYEDIWMQKKIRVANRVIGIPGDTVKITFGVIYVNNHKFFLPPTAIYHYSASVKTINEPITRDLNIQGETAGYYDCFLTESEAATRQELYKDVITFFRKEALPMNSKVLLNYQNNFGWDMDNFGPVSIPARGNIIPLDSAKIFLNEYDKEGEKSGVIKIEKPYYFVIGDNFHNATNDSRGIGLIAGDQILGAIKM